MRKKISSIILVMVIVVSAVLNSSIALAQDYEGFLADYTEIDPGDDLAIGLTSVVWDAIPNGLDSFVYDDKGSNYFDGSFQVTYKAKWSASTSGVNTGSVWAVSNHVGTIVYHNSNNYDMLALLQAHPSSPDEIRWYLLERNGASQYQSTGYFTPDASTFYYVKIIRDETVGTYGTLYAYIYSDDQYTVLEETITLTLHSKNDFRYNYAFQNNGTGGAYFNTGEIANMIVTNYSGFGYEPTVTIAETHTTLGMSFFGGAYPYSETVTDAYLEYGTSTGNYSDNITLTITDTGAAWGLSGSIESANLTDGITYYYRAGALNQYGWGYSVEKYFTYIEAQQIAVFCDGFHSEYDYSNGKYFASYFVNISPNISGNVSAAISSNVTDIWNDSDNFLNLSYTGATGNYFFSTWENGEDNEGTLDAGTQYYYQGRANYGGVNYYSKIYTVNITAYIPLQSPAVKITKLSDVSNDWNREYVVEVTAKIESDNTTEEVTFHGFQFSDGKTPDGNLIPPIHAYFVNTLSSDSTYTAVYDLSETDWFDGGDLHFRAFIDANYYGKVYSDIVSIELTGETSEGTIVDTVDEVRAALGLYGIMGTWAFLGLVELVIALIFGILLVVFATNRYPKSVLAAVGLTWFLAAAAALGAFLFSGQLGIWPILVLVGGLVLLILVIGALAITGNKRGAT